ncbi:MAG: amidohydrolase family protein [Balneolaceae bacterium]
MNKKIQYLLGAILIALLPMILEAQNPPAYAVDNVSIHLANGSEIESGIIVWRNGIIEAIGRNITIPYDAYTIDGGDSLHVYPGFIDGLGTWGAPDLPKEFEDVDDPGNPGYERAGIQPQREINEYLDSSKDNITDAMKLGFTTASLGLKGFMFPGTAGIYFLNGNETKDHLFREFAGLQFAFEGAPGGWGSRAYPSTTMGVMARFRQLLYDAQALKDHIQYYASADGNMVAPKRDAVLESLFPFLNNEITLFATADTPEDLDRLLILKEEFEFDIVLISGKHAALSSEKLLDHNIPVLASVELPEKPDWIKERDKEADEDEEKGESKETAETEEPLSEEEKRYRERQEKAYNDAARNIKSLMEAGITVGFSSAGLEADEFKEQLLNLKKYGNLTEQEILQLMTVNTAEILNISSKMGEIESGNLATFSIFTSPYFDKESDIVKVISNGVIHEF